MQKFSYYVESQLLLKEKVKPEKKSPPSDKKKRATEPEVQPPVELDVEKDKPLSPLLVGMKMLYLRSNHI